jgi:hypothetical protein
MLAQLSKALSEGFTADQVLDYILKKFPSHKKKIEKAISGGFNASQILTYLSKQSSGKGNIEEPSTEFEQMRGQDIQGQQERGKKALAAGTLAATSLAAPIAASALQRALPSSLSSLVPSLTAQTIGSNLGQVEGTPQQNTQQPPVNQVQPNITQPIETVQPEVISNPKEYLEKLGIKNSVDDLLKRGNTPEGVMAALQLKGGMGKAKTDPELLANIEAYSKQPKDEAITETEMPKIEKSSIVASPQGVGEVKEIRNGKAIVEIDGKKHQVNEDELIDSPLPEKELADLYDDLISGVEHETEEDVSRMVNWAGYDPNTGKLAFLPHDGGLYTYSNLSPEDVTQLTDVLSTRKTSGSNFIGAWKAKSKSPIGAAMSALIKRLQAERGGKGNEYEEKFDTVYNYLEPAIKAKKKKKKK